jgi:hypothetical protein
MGIFTYRQTKKTKQAVRKLGTQQRELAVAQSMEQQRLAAQARETELFQQLPAEGKAEFRAFVDAYRVQYASMSRWQRNTNGKKLRSVYNELNKNKATVYRKYDLIP